MHELFLLIAIIVATVVLMADMMFLFKGYFDQRAKIDRDAGRYSPASAVSGFAPDGPLTGVRTP